MKLVEYDSKMNELNFGKFNEKELDLFFSICHKMKNKDIEDVSLTFQELKTLSGYSQKGLTRFIKDLQSVYRKLLNINMTIETKTTITGFVLFTKYKIEKDAGVVEITVNKEFKYILNNISKFTKFDLMEFTNLKSSYARNLFRLFKQYDKNSEGSYFYKVKIEDFRNLLEVPKSYKMADIDIRILHPCLEQLKPLFPGLTLEKIKVGVKITNLLFTWKKTNKHLNKEIEVIEPEIVEPTGTLIDSEFSIYASEQFRKWWYDNIKEIIFHKKYIPVIENLKISESETKKYLIDITQNMLGKDIGGVINAIKNKTRPAESVKTEKDSILKAKKKDEIAEDIVNQDVMNLLEKPKEEVVIYNKNLLGIQQYLYAEISKIKIMTIAQSSRLINHFDNIEAAIEFGEGFEIDMSYFKTEIKIETVSEPEIKKELVEEKPQNDSQHKENSELIEILTM
ncbi:replication initiation protein, partial [Cetobacterium sp.]|uniref:replication initiation protein n=1 Tax=Cetobacterium sp. TaxID=2071632 RepID=UPI003F32A7C3